MSSGPTSVVLVCEGPGDRRTVPLLVDRVLLEALDWLDESTLDSFREWRGQTRSEDYLPWKKVHERANAANIRINGLFDGEPGAPDAFAARRALALLQGLGDDPIDAVLLIRDSDGDSQRRKGLEQARAEVNSPCPILIGVAHTKRECWILAGFTPETPDEKKRHEELQRTLGADPCLHAEELTATEDNAKRNAKRVLEQLHGLTPKDSVERESRCLKEPSLQQLDDRGRGTGLAAFFSEVREKLVPLWSGAPPPRSKGK